MRDVYNKIDNKHKVSCDFCKKEIFVDDLNDWAISGDKDGWLIASVSPVPFMNLDVCPDCVKEHGDMLSGFFNKISETAYSGIAYFSLIQRYFSLLLYRYSEAKRNDKLTQ